MAYKVSSALVQITGFSVVSDTTAEVECYVRRERTRSAVNR